MKAKICHFGVLLVVLMCGSQWAFTAPLFEPLRAISPVDNPNILSPTSLLERNLLTLNSSTPRIETLTTKPWANGSWHLQTGLLANRYADSGFVAVHDWNLRLQYDHDNPPGTADSDTLSPAEKYDLLVGDSQQTLTQAQWQAGRRYLVNGAIPGWMGICEGSAAASVLYPEPKHEVDLKTPSGETVRFHVMDIKGLVALLWSAYNVNIPVSGDRCKTKTPRKDQNGVVIDDACFSSNPGSFHIAVLNFLGQQKRLFFMNRVNDTEVWNVPVIGYKVRYFNPQSGAYFDNLTSAIAPVSSLAHDIYRRYRSVGTASIVGVDMTVRIATGSTPQRDQAIAQQIKTLNYKYDLELNTNGEILGGEWHQYAHPNFTWQVEAGYVPSTVGDEGLNATWNGGAVPASWLGPIRQSSALNQPLEMIVSELVTLSTQ
jgi:hypothetical protein